ncbi:MAG: hypothetical protein Q9185_005571 [Variospora sp. 1 TL-2023]
MAGTTSIKSRKRGGAPKKTPGFPQRASGKSWNQALRDVGFHYSTTFQDMQGIRRDGKTYAATRKTAVKNQVGTIVGESRHVLHPAAVDSVLQLLIVSICAGRANVMSYGAVPDQVDEIAIFTPNAKQVGNGVADCNSWIDQRGLRSYVGASQLVATDGELLMEISDMRCISYGAALPQRAEEPLKPQLYGGMVWKLDIDYLQCADKLPSLNISDLVELSLCKKHGSEVLEYRSDYTHETLSRPEDSHSTIAETTAKSVESVGALVESFKKSKVQKLDLSIDLESQRAYAVKMTSSLALPTSQDDALAAIQAVSTTASSLLWVIKGGLLTDKKRGHAMAAGLARVIASEHASFDLTTLEFDLDKTDAALVPTMIARAAKEQMTRALHTRTKHPLQTTWHISVV